MVLAEIARTTRKRRQSGTDPKQNPDQVPTTDPQFKVRPNKAGGFAPNDPPTALTDGESGIILDANVLDVVNESGEALPAVDRVTELCGAAPENFLADGGNASGAILAGLEKREIKSGRQDTVKTFSGRDRRLGYRPRLEDGNHKPD